MVKKVRAKTNGNSKLLDVHKETEYFPVLEAMFNSSLSGTVIISPDTHLIVDLNDTAVRLIGLPREEIIGNECFNFICPHNRGNCPITDRGLLVDNSECLLVNKEGRLLPILKTVVQRDVNNRNLLIESFTDISHQKKIEKEKEELILGLQNALNQIRIMTQKQFERDDQIKRDLVAVVSHEIRTPLTGIMGMNHILKHTRLSSEQKECVDIIENSAHHLLEVLNNVLDFTKLDAGERHLESVPFDLYKLLKRTCAVFSHYKEHHLDFIYSLSHMKDIKVVGDPTALRQILFNLLNNAFKFTPTGNVLLTADYRNGMLSLIVEDSGIGIPEEKQSLIFEPFKQADESKTRIYGGTGLGLAVTKALIDNMHGTISVISKSGEGTIFTVELPFEEYHGKQIDSSQKTSLALQHQNKEISILIVDDNAVNRKVTERFLQTIESISFDFSFAANGFDAVEQAKNEKFDIILMDIMMPVMCGEEATKIIRTLDAYRNVPIIALTAEAVNVSKSYYQQFGFCEYLSKPIQKEDLVKVITTFCKDNAEEICTDCIGTCKNPE